MADGSVKIDVKLILNNANAEAKKLASTLKNVDVGTGAASHVNMLTQALDRASMAAKKGEASQHALGESLKTQSRSWEQLADAQSKSGLKTSAQVSTLNSLKAKLASVGVATQEASQKFKDAVVAEGANSDAAKDAARSYTQLKGEQAALSLQVSSLQKRFGGLTPSMAAAADRANQLGDRFQNAGQKISSVGNKMTLGLTAPIVAGLGLATKAAVGFDSQIQSMGPLLDDGSVSASTLKAQMAGLGDASKKWSVQYGVSTSSINDGMTELIKKGYTYNQTLGAMPSILDAARASGDDFNSVMSVSTSTLEQFGLKSNNTATMLKNTQRVTDSLTFVANKTSAGFSDMGMAMEYVGPVAHGLNISLEQTAAMIGEMSNQGIEGQKAGTALRGALSSLMNPSAQNTKGFKALGVSVADFKRGALTMPQMLDNIRAKSKGMTKQQLQSNLALAFGTEAQTGMNILVSQGGDALRDLTKETQNSTGYTKKLAQTMNQTSQANVDKFKASLNVLAIDMGAKLLPTLTDMLKEGTKLVDWFATLDDGTKKLIINSALALAAGGPLISMFGKLSSGVGALYHGGARLITWLGRFGSGASAAAPSANLAANAIKGVGAGATVATEGGTGLLAALGPLAPGLGIVAAAAVAGGVAWELWGKKAYQTQQNVANWGSNVSKSTADVAEKMRTLNVRTESAMNGTAKVSTSSAKDIGTAFKALREELDRVAASADKTAAAMKKGMNSAQASTLDKQMAAAKKSRASDLSDLETYTKRQQTIYATAAKEHRGLTSAEQVEVEDLQQQSYDKQLNLLNLHGEKRRAMLAALSGDIEHMTMTRVKNVSDTLAQEAESGTKSYQKELNGYKKLYQSGSITYTDYLKDRASTTKTYIAENSSAMATYTKAMYKQELRTALANAANNGLTTQQAKTLAYGKTLTDLAQTYGITQAQAKKFYDSLGGAAKTSMDGVITVTAGMNESTYKAASMWNNLKLRDKNGKFVSNAPQIVAEAMQDKEKWNQMKLLLKEGRMDSNTKMVVSQAMFDAGKWNTKDWKTAELLAQNQTDKDVIDALQSVGKWDKLTPVQQKLIAQAKTKAGLTSALKDTSMWNTISKSVRNALLKAIDQATGPAAAAKRAVDEWNQKHAKTITMKTVLETVTTSKGSAAAENSTNRMAQAHGNTYFGGGLAMVNDQASPTYREAIRLPTGETFSFKERNVTTYLPRGTEIVPAAKSRALDLVPRYANGTGGALTDAIDRYMTITPEMASSFTPNPTAITYGPAASSSNKLDSVARSLEQLVGLLTQQSQGGSGVPDVLAIQVAANIDGKPAAKALAPEMRVQLNKLNKLNLSHKGVRQ